MRGRRERRSAADEPPRDASRALGQRGRQESTLFCGRFAAARLSPGRRVAAAGQVNRTIDRDGKRGEGIGALGTWHWALGNGHLAMGTWQWGRHQGIGHLAMGTWQQGGQQGSGATESRGGGVASRRDGARVCGAGRIGGRGGGSAESRREGGREKDRGRRSARGDSGESAGQSACQHKGAPSEAQPARAGALLCADCERECARAGAKRAVLRL